MALAECLQGTKRFNILTCCCRHCNNNPIRQMNIQTGDFQICRVLATMLQQSGELVWGGGGEKGGREREKKRKMAIFQYFLTCSKEKLPAVIPQRSSAEFHNPAQLRVKENQEGKRKKKSSARKLSGLEIPLSNHN